MPAEDMFTLHGQIDVSLTLALNVKADGLQSMTADLLEKFGVLDAFVFDMSIPDMLPWLSSGVPVFTRHSDIEPEPPLYAEAAGVWLDGFQTEWWDRDVIARHLDAGKRVCIVSPDLHKRPHEATWENVAGWDICSHNKVLICTDYPEAAREFFSHED